ncbi:MAG: hypothetical protein ACRDHP_07910 [Ktedonobacterales bacterium]
MPALHWGLVFGIVQVIIGVVPILWLVANGYHIPPNATETQTILNQSSAALALFFVVGGLFSLASYVFAGFLTARDTGTVGAGALAAALACLANLMVSYLIAAIVLKISYSQILDEIGGLPASFRALLAISYALSTICGLVVGCVIAAGIGALGALLGCAIFGRASYS